MDEGSLLYNRRERIFLRLVGRSGAQGWFMIALGACVLAYGLLAATKVLPEAFAASSPWPFLAALFMAQYGGLILLGRHFIERRGMLDAAKWMAA